MYTFVYSDNNNNIMELTFNSKAKDGRVEEAYDQAMVEIKSNMDAGIRVTELYMDKDISAEVRKRIDKEIVEGKQFVWCTVRRDTNQYTGRPQSFTGATVGDQKYYKLKYFGD